jgi:hypothetical protein
MGEMDVQAHVSLPSALVRGECSASRPAALPPGKEPPVDVYTEYTTYSCVSLGNVHHRLTLASFQNELTPQSADILCFL